MSYQSKALDMSRRSTEELHKMVKALSCLPFLNTREDNDNLSLAKMELARRSSRGAKKGKSS